MTRRAVVIGTAITLILLLLTAGISRFAPFTPPATPATDLVGEQPGTVVLSMLIRNHGSEDDALLGGTIDFADALQPRLTTLVDGRRHDRPAPDGIPIPAGSTVILEPGGDHLAILGLHDDLIQGREFRVTLRFARAGDVEVTGRVRRKVDAAGSTPPPAVTAGEIEVWLVSAPPAPSLATPLP